MTIDSFFEFLEVIMPYLLMTLGTAMLFAMVFVLFVMFAYLIGRTIYYCRSRFFRSYVLSRLALVDSRCAQNLVVVDTVNYIIGIIEGKEQSLDDFVEHIERRCNDGRDLQKASER